MSERKVLQKYYPADFDPRDIVRTRGPKQTGPRIQTVRLMAPFSMKCLTCGEFVYRGRKFNSRKVTDQTLKYLNIQIFSFHIKCTRCSAEIIFRTDPKNHDYAMVRGAMRTMEPWRARDQEDETLDARLDRLEREEAEAAGDESADRNAMEELEARNADARREMAAADELDEIRQRNARVHRSERDGVEFIDHVVREGDEERARQEEEDAAAAKRAFANIIIDPTEEPAALEPVLEDDETSIPGLDGRGPGAASVAAESTSSVGAIPTVSAPVHSFKRTIKKKKNHSALLGIKTKPSLP